ncbi:putative serine/threonine-protein kinase gdt9 [Holothuria leucospilota]|uniref:Serine/threonine-protein kinase gdt9 n=1 Tax=Holothuria leucospilota TaxID=206669 RepID=A0A9Q1B906_HOLLE|nr:putative serine/threonine-protein kinase gdt9 [Holothuria leucospilota]
MDYVCFDFKPFGQDTSVSSLKDFLKFVDRINYEGFEHFNHFIATDIANGLKYLHDQDVAHRDLKPDNVLVCNRHYSELSEDERCKYWMSNPIVAKLTDFGESRATLVQTNTFLHSVTANVFRGTPVFMAPEVLQHDGRDKMDINDMKSTDIWSYSMILFMLMNPDLKYPYQLEIADAMESGPSKPARDILCTIFAAQKLPRNSNKYQQLRKTEWSTIETAYSQCAQFRTDRPSAAKIALLLKDSASSNR